MKTRILGKRLDTATMSMLPMPQSTFGPHSMHGIAAGDASTMGAPKVLAEKHRVHGTPAWAAVAEMWGTKYHHLSSVMQQAHGMPSMGGSISDL